MKIEEYLPADKLKPFIKAYKIIESQNEITNRVLPGTSFTMAFRLRGIISYISNNHKNTLPSATFSGLQKGARLIHYEQNTTALIVLFREQGISSFFRQPLHELFGQSVSLDNYFPASEILTVEERMADAGSNMARISIVEQFLYSKLTCNHPDKLVSEAINRIHSFNGSIRIKELTNHFHISQDAFEKRFRKLTGTTPKQFSQIVKMSSVISQNSSTSSLLDIALENGYYDQPHFNKDFKIFTGQTPSEFFKAPSFW